MIPCASTYDFKNRQVKMRNGNTYFFCILLSSYHSNDKHNHVGDIVLIQLDILPPQEMVDRKG